MAKCRSCEILNSTQAHIKKALVTNFKGEKYITSVHLEQLLTPNLLHDILSHATWQSDHQTILDTKNIENQVGEIKSKALRLLALCIWIELPLSTFKRLFDEGLGDDNLPFSEPFTHPLIDATSSEVLLKSQTYFIPYTIYLDGVHHDFRAERPIPILFEESDDRIGCGSFSDVFKVEVDSDVGLSSSIRIFTPRLAS